jgi:hypothetical protein
LPAEARNDFHARQELEDLIAVVDGRAETGGRNPGCVERCPFYLAKEIEKLISIREFNDTLPVIFRPTQPESRHD